MGRDLVRLTSHRLQKVAEDGLCSNLVSGHRLGHHSPPQLFAARSAEWVVTEELEQLCDEERRLIREVECSLIFHMRVQRVIYKRWSVSCLVTNVFIIHLCAM